MVSFDWWKREPKYSMRCIWGRDRRPSASKLMNFRTHPVTTSPIRTDTACWWETVWYETDVSTTENGGNEKFNILSLHILIMPSTLRIFSSPMYLSWEFSWGYKKNHLTMGPNPSSGTCIFRVRVYPIFWSVFSTRLIRFTIIPSFIGVIA
jgi:hypothetical protein